MEVFRLARKKYPIELSGKGAALVGARWNSKGTEIIYTAQNRALAMAEVVVHLSLATMPSDFVMLTIAIPSTVPILELPANQLPLDWNTFPAPFDTALIGDHFVQQNEFAVLKVPSAVVQGDYNYLINPHHKDFTQIQIVDQVDFPFDQRIFK
jgi:RES domain-containing protein